MELTSIQLGLNFIGQELFFMQKQGGLGGHRQIRFYGTWNALRKALYNLEQ